MNKFRLQAVALTLLAGWVACSSCAVAGEDDPFTIVKVIPGCSYFIAETPTWYVVAEDWMCSMPSEGDTGIGNLITYSSTKVQLNGTSCDLWVETWGGESTVIDRLKQKCNL